MGHYSTKVVIDIGTGEILERDRIPWDGPWELLHQGRSPLEGQAQSISEQNRQQQATDYGTAQGTLSQFEGPVQDSPYYKSLVATGTDATSQAYESAKADQAAKARAAGFGYEQPVTQGAESGVAAQEAGALARIPAQAEEAAAPLALQAAGETAGMGTALGSEGVGYFNDATTLEEQYQKQQQGFMSKLWDVGSGVAAGMGL